MRVLVPALLAAAPRTGVATYLEGICHGLVTLAEPVHRLDVGAADPDQFAFLDGFEVARVWPLRRGTGTTAGRLAAFHLQIPALARRLHSDVILSPHFIAPRLGLGLTAAVVAQDLAFVHFASTIPFARRMYYLATVRASFRRAPVILVSTRTMAREVAEFEPSVASRIRIAPLGVSPTHLATVTTQRTDHSGGLLCVGTLEPRKNLARVLSAHGRLCRRFSDFPELRLVGALGWGQRAFVNALAQHPAPERVIRLGFLSGPELAAEYRKARGLVFLSLYEGFGLPVVEAMQHGCPVLCSRGTALAEVADGAALLADPTEVGEIEAAMLRLVEDGDLGGRLRAAGLVRARDFTWERCARRTMDALEELVA